MEHAVFRPLIKPKSRALKTSMTRLASELQGTSERGILQFRVLDGATRHVWCLRLKDKTVAQPGPTEETPDLEIVLRQDTWQEIACGQLSPVDAYLGGRLRVRGDYEMAKRLLRSVSVSPDASVDPCEENL